MSRNIYILAGILIVGFLILVSGGLLSPLIISGYGGISSGIHSVEHGYNPDYVDVTNTGTTASVTPNTLGAIGATGIRLELGQPQYKSDDPRYSNEIIETDDYGETKRNWAVHIAYFDMSFTIKTEGAGMFAISDVTFWIDLQENQFDVFTAADDVEAYILEVVTLEPVATTDVTLVDVEPAAGGFSFNMVPVESEPIPFWMSDSGYQGALSDLKHIRFSVHVNSMSPFQLGFMRVDHTATWSCEVRALVFGYWEVYSPYDVWKPPEFWNPLGWLADIFPMLMTPFGIALAIVAIIGTMVVLVKAPGYFLKVFGVVAIWLAVFFVLMLFGVAVL